MRAAPKPWRISDPKRHARVNSAPASALPQCSETLPIGANLRSLCSVRGDQPLQKSRSGLLPGTLVEVRGRGWRLVDRQHFEGCSLITLQGVERGDIGETLCVVTPFDRVTTGRRRPRLRIAGRIAVAQRVSDAILSSHPWNGCWTAATASIDLMPWQLEPALAVLAGATRVLLADAVGMGKTVQAGLILAELLARGLIDRALVLTPAGLRAQWADELGMRFGLRPAVLDQTALAREAANLPAETSPWGTSAIVVSSIDLVKRAEVLTAVDRVPFDLLIVDEVHHVTPDSDRGALVARIAGRTPWIVLVSATPHSGDDRAFAFLRDLGSSGSEPLTIFRRTVPQRERRTRTKLVAVRTSATERALLDEVQDYAKAIWSARGATNAAARLVAIVLARRAASSAEAVLSSLLRRRLLLVDAESGALPDQASLPWEELDGRDGDEADHVLGTPGLPHVDEERRRLDRLIDLARHARELAAKPRWIQRFLARAREPAIVFSEYRDTVEALRPRFERTLPVVTLHGGLTPTQRRAATSAFVEGNAMLLLATDAGGEGLNLHARCRTVINVELPWNPLRLEQRVGRVDRIGQQRRVHAIHLLHAGSIEQTVLAHLHRRVARAATLTVPGDHDIEARVAEVVLGGSHAPSLALPEWPTASMPLAVEDARRLQALRQLTGASQSCTSSERRPASNVPVSTPRRRARASSSVVGAFHVTLAHRDGRALASVVVPLSVALSSRLPSTRRELLAVLRQLTDDTSTRALVAARAAELLRSSSEGAYELARAVADRVAALSAASTVDRVLYQPALFDTRSTRLATERSAVQEIHRRHLDRIRRALRGFDAQTMPPPALIGIWLRS
jgi:superfamily II DNA or RNA helicase